MTRFLATTVMGTRRAPSAAGMARRKTARGRGWLLAAALGAVAGPLVLAQPGRAAGRADTATEITIAGLKGSAQNPCWLPGDNTIAYTNFLGRYNSGNSIIRGVSPAGGAPTRSYGALASDDVNLPGQCRSASLGLIAFSSGADQVTDEIWVAKLIGGTGKRLTNRPNNSAWEPSFSPVLHDGSTWIVFESHNLAGNNPGTIWKVKSDGTGLAQLTTGHDDRQPQWSPAGDRILFQRAIGTGWDVITIDPNGGSPVDVTSNPPASNTDPSWSPTGKYIVYSAGGPGIAIANLWIIAAGGGTPLRLTTYPTGYDGAPGWSNNGKYIAFESAPNDPDLKGNTTIWKIAAPAGIY